MSTKTKCFKKNKEHEHSLVENTPFPSWTQTRGVKTKEKTNKTNVNEIKRN